MEFLQEIQEIAPKEEDDDDDYTMLHELEKCSHRGISSTEKRRKKQEDSLNRDMHEEFKRNKGDKVTNFYEEEESNGEVMKQRKKRQSSAD